MAASPPMTSTASLVCGAGLGPRLPMGVAARDNGAELEEERDVRLLLTSLAVEAAVTWCLEAVVRVAPE